MAALKPFAGLRRAQLALPFQPLSLARTLFFLLFFGCPLLLAAQQPFGGPPNNPSAASATTRTAPPDTMPLLFTLSLSPERATLDADTLPNVDFRMYDPARRSAIDWGTLGNFGSSARPLFFQTAPKRGFDSGIHPFDLYRLQAENLRFYRNSHTFSEAYFSQGASQNENAVGVKLSRTFDGGLNFSIDYRNINNQGQYRYQNVRHSSLSVGVWYPVNKRYQFFLIYNNNANQQRDNGGIVSDDVFGSGRFDGPINAEIRLPGQQATTRQTDWTGHFTQHLTFDFNKRAVRGAHTLNLGRQLYKFSDVRENADETAGDSIFYRSLWTDERGLRQYFTVFKVDNNFDLSTFRRNKKGSTSDAIAAGLRHTLYILEQEPQDSAISNLFLTGRIAFTPSERLQFTVKGELGVLSNFGEYSVGGNLLLGLGRFGELRGELLSQRTPPALAHHRLYVSKRQVWNNDFQKPVETTISATYALRSIGFSATGRTHLINNYLYFDQKGLPVQAGAPVQVAQLLLSENFRLGKFHFDNTAALQQTNRGDVLRLPQWFTKNSVYFSGKIFKKRMATQVGFDFRMNGEFTPDAYQPLLAQFYLQDTLKQKPYPWLDAFISVKVQRFRFFFRYENLSSLWDPTAVFYQTAYQPQGFASFRLGINWRFMDSNVAEQQQNTGSPGGFGGGRGGGFGGRRGF